MVAFIFFIYMPSICQFSMGLWLCCGFACSMQTFCKQYVCAVCVKIAMFAKTDYI